MSLRDNPLGELKVPLTWTAGIVFLVVLIVSVGILLGDRREAFDTDEYGNPRTLSDRVMAPVGDSGRQREKEDAARRSRRVGEVLSTRVNPHAPQAPQACARR